MKVESDPITEKANKILYELYSPYIKHWGKHCPEFCGNKCTCDRRISFSERERILRQVKDKMRV